MDGGDARFGGIAKWEMARGGGGTQDLADPNRLKPPAPPAGPSSDSDVGRPKPIAPVGPRPSSDIGRSKPPAP
eukprot:4508282-Prymnesium_polylepis.1